MPEGVVPVNAERDAVIATIVSAKMTEEETLAAEAIEAAVSKVLLNNRTPDIYEDGMNKVSCEQMGDLVCAEL